MNISKNKVKIRPPTPKNGGFLSYGGTPKSAWVSILTWSNLAAFGVVRRPPWKWLSSKPQTALAQAQQEHGFCVKHSVCMCLCITRFLCKTALCGKDGFDAKPLVLFKPQFKFKSKACV